MSIHLILLGPPGAGKGTYSEVLSSKYNIPIISTGNILREAVQKRTPLGLEAKSYMDEGKLAPDALIIKIIKERLSSPDCKQGFLLDGFPRTQAQAEAFDKIADCKITVIYIYVPRDILVRRLTSRRVCGKCNTPYNIISKPPKKENICDICGENLIQRSDDKEEVIRKRLMVYEEQTKPLIEYYQNKKILRQVEGNNNIDEVVAKIISLI